jgi:hypothetical protein
MCFHDLIFLKADPKGAGKINVSYILVKIPILLADLRIFSFKAIGDQGKNDS